MWYIIQGAICLRLAWYQSHNAWCMRRGAASDQWSLSPPTTSTTHHYSNKSMHKGQCCAERLAYVSRRVALQRRSFRQHETFVASYCIYVKTQHCIKIVQQENLALATARSSIPLLICTNIFDTNCIVSVIPSPEWCRSPQAIFVQSDSIQWWCLTFHF